MIHISYLTHLIPDRLTKELRLHQSEITKVSHYDDWSDFLLDFFGNYTYPYPQSSKAETYSFVPSLFNESWSNPNYKGDQVFGLWRNQANCKPFASILLMDVDNAQSTLKVTMDWVEARLKLLNKCYAMYSSYSHKAGEHEKFRVMIPFEREFDGDEIWRAYHTFNDLLGNQADAAIYDFGDHLYCPPYNSDIRFGLEGDFIMLSELRDDCPVRVVSKSLLTSKLTPEQVEKLSVALSNDVAEDGVSIHNKKYCRPEWIVDLQNLYRQNSHHASMFSTMSRIWWRNQGSLTYGDMRHMFTELDLLIGNYMISTYGEVAIKRNIYDVMKRSPPIRDVKVNNFLEQHLRRKKKK